MSGNLSRPAPASCARRRINRSSAGFQLGQQYVGRIAWLFVAAIGKLEIVGVTLLIIAQQMSSPKDMQNHRLFRLTGSAFTFDVHVFIRSGLWWRGQTKQPSL